MQTYIGIHASRVRKLKLRTLECPYFHFEVEYVSPVTQQLQSKQLTQVFSNSTEAWQQRTYLAVVISSLSKAADLSFTVYRGRGVAGAVRWLRCASGCCC